MDVCPQEKEQNSNFKGVRLNDHPIKKPKWPLRVRARTRAIIKKAKNK